MKLIDGYSYELDGDPTSEGDQGYDIRRYGVLIGWAQTLEEVAAFCAPRDESNPHAFGGATARVRMVYPLGSWAPGPHECFPTWPDRCTP